MISIRENENLSAKFQQKFLHNVRRTDIMLVRNVFTPFGFTNLLGSFSTMTGTTENRSNLKPFH